MPVNNLKGNNSIAPTILNTTPIVNPKTANGSNKSQTKPRRKNRPIASGQHSTNNMQKRSIAIKSFIYRNFRF
jgi:hypothetical protein